MRYRKLDADGDMLFGHGQGDIWRDCSDAVAQSVWTRLRLWKGEWFVDTSAGTPWREAALGVGKRRTIEPAIRARILQTPGVNSLESFELTLDPDARCATIAAMIETDYGTATLQGIL